MLIQRDNWCLAKTGWLNKPCPVQLFGLARVDSSCSATLSSWTHRSTRICSVRRTSRSCPATERVPRSRKVSVSVSLAELLLKWCRWQSDDKTRNSTNRAPMPRQEADVSCHAGVVEFYRLILLNNLRNKLKNSYRITPDAIYLDLSLRNVDYSGISI